MRYLQRPKNKNIAHSNILKYFRCFSPSHSGFTLVELAIVMVISGLLIGMGMRIIGPLTKRAKRAEIRETINAARESILGYTLANRVLPQTLAQAGARDKDAYNNPIYYVFPSGLTSGSICTVLNTGLQLDLCPDSTCSSPISSYQDVAVLLVSKGGNYNLQTDISGSPSIKIYQAGTSPIDDYATNDPNRAEEYDDIYSFVSLNELKLKAGCASSLGFCHGYEVWNNIGNADFLINGTTCVTITNGAVISTLPPGGTINKFSSTDTTCSGSSTGSVSFSQAQSADDNKNCSINLDLTDK